MEMSVLVEATEAFSSKWPVSTLFQPSYPAWMVQFSEGGWCESVCVCSFFRISIYRRKVLALRSHQKHRLDDEQNQLFVLSGETFEGCSPSVHIRLHDGVWQWRMRDEGVGRVFWKTRVKFIFTYLGLKDLFSKQSSNSSNSMRLHIILSKLYWELEEYFASFSTVGFLALATQNELQFLSYITVGIISQSSGRKVCFNSLTEKCSSYPPFTWPE